MEAWRVSCRDYSAVGRKYAECVIIVTTNYKAMRLTFCE